MSPIHHRNTGETEPTMSEKFSRVLVFLSLVLVALSLGQSGNQADAAAKPQSPRYVEFLASQSVTQQEDIGTGALASPVISFNLTANTLSIQFDSVLRYGASGQGLSRNFTVSIRVDGVAVNTVPVTSLDGGLVYQAYPFSLNADVNGLPKGTHVIDIYFNAGTESVNVFSSPSSPTTLTVTQY